jgi:hypothetical protein
MSEHRPSATILRFVPRNRTGMAAREARRPAPERSPQAAAVDTGAWYHAAAVEAAARDQQT